METEGSLPCLQEPSTGLPEDRLMINYSSFVCFAILPPFLSFISSIVSLVNMGNYKFLPWIYITTNEKDCFAKKKPISI
jgi:hypothetical protein